LLSGEPGVGKTRLAQEFAEEARRRGTRVLSGCAEQPAEAYQPLLEAIREGLPSGSGEAARKPADWVVGELAGFLPELRGRLSSPPRPWPSSAGGRERILEAFTQMFGALARSHPPLLLVLDDLHRADPATREWLGYVSPRLGKLPLLVVGVCRGGERARELRDLSARHDAHVKCLPVERLSREAVSDLLGRLAPGLPLGWRHRLYETSQGNPLFLVAVLQGLFEEGVFGVTEEGAWIVPDRAELPQGMAVPAAVGDVIRRRLKALGGEERELLNLLAVMGVRWDDAWLERAWDSDPAPLLRQLKERQLIIEGKSGCSFSHPLMREVVYQGLPKEACLRLHRRVAQALEASCPDPDGAEERAAELAHHYLEGRLWEKAFHYTRCALERALKRWELGEGVRRADQALELLEKTGLKGPVLKERRFEILKRRIHCCRFLGERGRQERDVQELLALAQELGDKGKVAEALQAQGEFYEGIGDFPRAEALARRALTLQEELGDRRGRALLLRRLGILRRQQGDARGALPYLEEARKIAQQLEDKALEGDVLNSLGSAHWQLGEYPEALACFKRGLALKREANDLRGEGALLGNLGMVYAELGETKKAEDCYEQARRRMHEIGDRVGESNNLTGLGILYAQRGRFAKALLSFERAYVLREEAADRYGTAMALLNVGLVYLDVGCYEEARGRIERALKAFRELGAQSAQVLPLLALGEVHKGLGDEERARWHFEEGRKLAEELEHRHGQAEALKRLGSLCGDRGEHERGAAYLEEALERYQALGEKEFQAETLSELAALYLKLGRTDEALKASKEALMIAEECGVGHLQKLHLIHAQVLETMGEEQEARRFYRRACEELQERLGRIGDEVLKETYLNLPFNREILHEGDPAAR